MHSRQLVMKRAFLLAAVLAHLCCAAQAAQLNAASVAALKGFLDTCCRPATSAACKELTEAVNPARKASDDVCIQAPSWCDAQGNLIQLTINSGFGSNKQLTCKTFPTKELLAMDKLEGLAIEGELLAGDLRDVTAMLVAMPNLKEFYGDWNRLTGSLSCQLLKPGMTTLELTGNSISGQIPGCLLTSPTLKALSIGNNKLSGPLPIPASNIPLEALFLPANSISGPIPPEFVRMSNLQRLQLGANQLTGPIPQLPSGLKSLHLYYNHLIGTIPNSLSQLKALTHLYLHGNKLVGTIPAALLSPQLVHLSLFGNKLTGRIDNLPWGNLKTLSRLWLSRNKLTGPVPVSIATMPSLVDLSSVNCSLSGSLDAFAAALPSSTNLAIVGLGGNQLTGGVPQGLNKLKTFSPLSEICDDADSGECHLPVLNLDGNPLDGAFPAWLSVALQPFAKQADLRVKLPTTLQCSTATLNAAVQQKYNFSCRKDGRQVKVPVASAIPGRRMFSHGLTQRD